jgi:hypothetical protein
MNGSLAKVGRQLIALAGLGALLYGAWLFPIRPSVLWMVAGIIVVRVMDSKEKREQPSG